MKNIQTLTDQEIRDAELHHNWVYSFLHRHSYSIEDFYDVVIMGYLKGIQDYHRKPGVKEKYSMSTICERAMHNEIATYFRDENRQKRKPSGGFVSLDAILDDSNDTFINTIITPTFEDEYFEAYDREHIDDNIKTILAPLSAIQRKIVILKASGKTLDYISKKLHISKFLINQELSKLKAKIFKAESIGTELTQRRKTIRNVIEYIGIPTEIILTLKLSTRQLDVINLLMIGYTESEVGRQLNISRQAVYDALKKIKAKADKLHGSSY